MYPVHASAPRRHLVGPDVFGRRVCNTTNADGGRAPSTTRTTYNIAAMTASSVSQWVPLALLLGGAASLAAAGSYVDWSHVKGTMVTTPEPTDDDQDGIHEYEWYKISYVTTGLWRTCFTAEGDGGNGACYRLLASRNFCPPCYGPRTQHMMLASQVMFVLAVIMLAALAALAAYMVFCRSEPTHNVRSSWSKWTALGAAVMGAIAFVALMAMQASVSANMTRRWHSRNDGPNGKPPYKGPEAFQRFTDASVLRPGYWWALASGVIACLGAVLLVVQVWNAAEKTAI